MRNWLVVAGVFGALGVALGAFGAHWLPRWLESSGLPQDEIERRMQTFETGVRYHMFHAVVLMCLGILSKIKTHKFLNRAGFCFTGGVTIFSGLLYLIALTGMKILGAIVPLGGLLLIAGWVHIAIAGVGIKPKAAALPSD